MDQVDEIKKRLDIVEFIGQYLQLKKAGINYSACCPFHSEKTPSFMVSPERQTFKCFGCGEGGDVFTFVEKMEGLSFPETLRILGERTGVQVEMRPAGELKKEKSQKDRLYKVNLLSAKFFKAMLWSKTGKPALDYLKGRGLSEETIKKLKIGFAPDGFELERYFKKFDLTPNDASQAGNPQRFRYRIMFPIFSTFDQVVGFSGRILESVLPKGVLGNPKYLNTPETVIFHKSKVLYGLNFAKQAIREKKRAVVVEGQMDVAAAHEAGVEEVVATSGTALTRDHLQILGRYTPNVIFAFDEDEAGQKTAKQAAQMAYELGLDPRMAIIDGAKDIGELVQNDKLKLEKVLISALPPVEWAIKKAKISVGDKELTGKEKKELVSLCLSFIVKMQDEVEKFHFISLISKSVGIPQVTIEKALNQVKVKKALPQNKPEEIKRDLEAEFLSFILHFPKIACEVTLEEKLEFQNPRFNDIYNQVAKCYNLTKDTGSCLKNILSGLDHETQELFSVCALVWDKLIEEDRDIAIRDFVSLKAKLLYKTREDVKQIFASKIAQAEARGDLQEVRHLMEDLQKNLGK